jgi:hypothetical protein
MDPICFGRPRRQTQGPEAAAGSCCCRKREAQAQRTSSRPPEFQLHVIPSAILECAFGHHPRRLSSVGDTIAASNNSPPSVGTSNGITVLTSDTNYRMVRSRSPTFPMFINDDCFIRVQTYMASISYQGPVALGCDDSKLHPSLQVYWDDSISEHILIGTTVQEKIIVANPEELRAMLVQYKNNVATKVCTISLCISLC